MIKLKYFPIRYLAEPSRLVLHYAGQPFLDIHVPYEDWRTLKPHTPFGTLPILELDNGKVLGQSHAIVKYLARQYGLCGKSSWEQARLDEIADVHKDFVTSLAPYVLSKAGVRWDDIELLRTSVFLKNIKKYCPFYEKLLTGGTGFLANSTTPTYADFMVADYFFTLNNLETETIKHWPVLIAHVDRIFNLPQLKEYISTRHISIV